MNPNELYESVFNREVRQCIQLQYEDFDMKKQLHMTILLVSHSMDDVARYADRIMVMRRGKLVYNDVPAEIFKHSAELEEMGLSAPQITYIMEYLQTRGLRVNADMLTVEEAAAEILKHRGELHV